MNKRILNGIAWTMLFSASILAVSDFSDFASPEFAFLLIGILGVACIPLFWLGGYNRDRCIRVDAGSTADAPKCSNHCG